MVSGCQPDLPRIENYAKAGEEGGARSGGWTATLLLVGVDSSTCDRSTCSVVDNASTATRACNRNVRVQWQIAQWSGRSWSAGDGPPPIAWLEASWTTTVGNPLSWSCSALST